MPTANEMAVLTMRTIDADAYIAEMHNRQKAAEDWIKSSTGANQIRAKATFLAYCEAALTLKNMPTIDAVPVVRCRECKHFQLNSWGTVNGVPLILAHEICDFWANGCKTNQDGYCFAGERKDGDT